MNKNDNPETDNVDDDLEIQVSRKKAFLIWLYFPLENTVFEQPLTDVNGRN